VDSFGSVRPERVTASHAFVQNLRRGHCEIATEQRANLPLAAAFSELARCL
jgi:IS6 family transposase